MNCSQVLQQAMYQTVEDLVMILRDQNRAWIHVGGGLLTIRVDGSETCIFPEPAGGNAEQWGPITGTKNIANVLIMKNIPVGDITQHTVTLATQKVA